MNVRAYWIRLAPSKGERIKVRGSAPMPGRWETHATLTLGKGEAKENALKP